MKFAETPISTQQTVYLKDHIMEALKLKVGDKIEWHIDNGEVVVRKKVK
jgi:formylmethanofuran dehydrogenase subunit D